MPIELHPSFDRPIVTTPLWRYVDLPKFVTMLTSRKIWLTNLEVLAKDDPYEGRVSAVQFPHRMWKTFSATPRDLQTQILQLYGKDGDGSPEAAFRSFVMLQEQHCLFEQYGRRNFFVNCWHSAEHESVAMWKIYGSPGPGLAIKSNGGRLEEAFRSTPMRLYLGSVRYNDPRTIQLGASNAFDTALGKRSNFSYEQEVRLVYRDTQDFHDPLVNDTWNEETMRFDNIVDDLRDVVPGVNIECDVFSLIAEVVISPFAPAWYRETITQLRDQLGFYFKISDSTLMNGPAIIA